MKERVLHGMKGREGEWYYCTTIGKGGGEWDIGYTERRSLT
jgi:hypothetical protein